MKSSKRGEVIRSEAAVSEYQHVVEPRWMSHLSTPAIIEIRCLAADQIFPYAA
jgi:hypothetical protein